MIRRSLRYRADAAYEAGFPALHNASSSVRIATSRRQRTDIPISQSENDYINTLPPDYITSNNDDPRARLENEERFIPVVESGVEGGFNVSSSLPAYGAHLRQAVRTQLPHKKKSSSNKHSKLRDRPSALKTCEGAESASDIRVIGASEIVEDDDDDRLPILNEESSIEGTSDGSSEHSVIVDETHIRIYKRRYWILFIFSFLTWFCCVEWNTWGPISESVFAVFPDWNSSTIAMMDNWVSFMFVCCVLPVCWATTKIGLRWGILFSSFTFAVGLTLRCITDKSPLFTIMCHLCSIFIGISMTLILSAPPMIASAWFPQNERTTAVAFILGIGQLGSVGSYLEPLFVRDPANNIPIHLIKSDIMTLLYFGAGVSAVLMCLFLIYFPSQPPHPPSYTSSRDRMNFKEGILTISRNKNFCMVVLIYGIASGPSLGWIGVLNFSLKPLGFTQDEAMFVGLVAVLSCFVMTLITGKITDHIFGYLKETIIILLLGAAFSFYWFLLLFENVVTFSRWQVFVSVSLGLSLNYATVPLFYEMAVEIVYPVHEVLVGGMVTAADSLSTSIFLFVYLVKNLGFSWVNYALVASNAIPVLMFLFVKPVYSRSKLDVPDNEENKVEV